MGNDERCVPLMQGGIREICGEELLPPDCKPADSDQIIQLQLRVWGNSTQTHASRKVHADPHPPLPKTSMILLPLRY